MMTSNEPPTAHNGREPASQSSHAPETLKHLVLGLLDAKTAKPDWQITIELLLPWNQRRAVATACISLKNEGLALSNERGSWTRNPVNNPLTE